MDTDFIGALTAMKRELVDQRRDVIGNREYTPKGLVQAAKLLVEIQTAIDATDRAIEDEKKTLG